jgi:hypothetical protein
MTYDHRSWCVVLSMCASTSYHVICEFAPSAREGQAASCRRRGCGENNRRCHSVTLQVQHGANLSDRWHWIFNRRSPGVRELGQLRALCCSSDLVRRACRATLYAVSGVYPTLHPQCCLAGGTSGTMEHIITRIPAELAVPLMKRCRIEGSLLRSWRLCPQPPTAAQHCNILGDMLGLSPFDHQD